MSKKNVLIVDDAKDILFLLNHTIKRLGPEYEVSTAVDAPMALEQAKQQKFDLVITDYMMTGMTGLDLIQSLRNIAPETQIVLMSAYDTSNLRDKVKAMQLDGYIGKPFTVDQIVEVVERAFVNPDHAPAAEISKPPAVAQDVHQQLKNLYNKTGAYYVLLLNSQGHPLHVVGRTERATLSRLAAFVASNFLAVTELASLLGDNNSIFKSSYHEGNNYNIYAHDINGRYLLAIVFGAKDKPGTVWFYTKQMAMALEPLLNPSSRTTQNDDSTLAAEFDHLLGEDRPD